ncbi:hypothetical protein [Lichenicola sp.]|uniref:hypothetical protein n=1 Tax=Lichenicola sp. TaxID=2804529 RepID=UPI003B0040E4
MSLTLRPNFSLPGPWELRPTLNLASLPNEPRQIPERLAVEALPAGWMLRGTRHVGANLILLDAENDLGDRRTWFAGSDGDLIGDRPDLLPHFAVAALRQQILANGPIELHEPNGSRRLDQTYMSAIMLDPVIASTAGLLLRAPKGGLRAIHHGDGVAILSFIEGWSPRLLFTGFAPLLLLDLVHDDGLEVVWYIDEEGMFLGGQVGHLDAVFRDAILEYGNARSADQPDWQERDLTGYCLLSNAIMAQISPLLAAPPVASTTIARHTRLAQADPARVLAMPPVMGVTLRQVERGDPAGDRSRDSQRPGWVDHDGRCLASGTGASLSFDLPYRPTVLRLSLELEAIGRPRRAMVTLNGWDVATFLLDLDIGAPERRDIWIPTECLSDNTARFQISFEPADKAIACSLGMARLEIGPEVAPVVVPATQDLMSGFVSLGMDCEFGFVQRVLGAEPMGLFRFAGSTNRLNLIRLIENDFKGMGAPGSLSTHARRAQVMRPGSGGAFEEVEEFYMTDRANRYHYHTWKGPADSTEAEAIAENEQKVAYLGRKMIEDFEDGDKIWVYRDMKPMADLPEVYSLHHAINRHGPNKLLWVTRVVTGRPAGAVEWIAPNLLRAYSDQTHGDAQTFDAQKWLQLCIDAYRAFGESTGKAASRTGAGDCRSAA